MVVNNFSIPFFRYIPPYQKYIGLFCKNHPLQSRFFHKAVESERVLSFKRGRLSRNFSSRLNKISVVHLKYIVFQDLFITACYQKKQGVPPPVDMITFSNSDTFFQYGIFKPAEFIFS